MHTTKKSILLLDKIQNLYILSHHVLTIYLCLLRDPLYVSKKCSTFKQACAAPIFCIFEIKVVNIDQQGLHRVNIDFGHRVRFFNFQLFPSFWWTITQKNIHIDFDVAPAWFLIENFY